MERRNELDSCESAGGGVESSIYLVSEVLGAVHAQLQSVGMEVEAAEYVHERRLPLAARPVGDNHSCHHPPVAPTAATAAACASSEARSGGVLRSLHASRQNSALDGLAQRALDWRAIRLYPPS